MGGLITSFNINISHVKSFTSKKKNDRFKIVEKLFVVLFCYAFTKKIINGKSNLPPVICLWFCFVIFCYLFTCNFFINGPLLLVVGRSTEGASGHQPRVRASVTAEGSGGLNLKP